MRLRHKRKLARIIGLLAADFFRGMIGGLAS